MKVALAEMDKTVVEKKDFDSQQKLWYLSLVSLKVEGLIDERFGSLRPASARRPSLDVPRLKNPLDKELKAAHGRLGTPLAEKNPEIGKYLASVRSDPVYDGGMSRTVPTAILNERGDWQVTAWCAAFVNWCLQQAGAPTLGYATARSWLQFGTPIPMPEYGCIVVIKPAGSTGSTTGHVAFYEARKGDVLTLIGGNQSVPRTKSSDRVNRMDAKIESVLGFRWPTAFNYFFLDRSTRVV
jgi:uncharacterized protein (TIGR02594 family)